jgi:two-component system phosphate regulon sensor histidine kinase PhoR
VLGVVAIFNDITEMRNLDRMKTAFVSTVSHELRTPLTSIKGFIDTLLQDTEGYFDDAARLEFYQIINGECDRLQRLIEDLLNVSRIESGKALQMHWSTFDPLPVIARVLQTQRAYVTHHQLRLQAHGHIPEITADMDKLEQILTNLISNAIKYSPSGGEVVVTVSSDVERLTIAVRDQGIGIPADKLPRLFEKFERVDNRDTRRVGGTGIGLFLVRNYVDSHGGEVWADSVLGQGSTFTFQIPIHSSKADEEMKQLAASEEADLRQLESFTRGGFSE